LLLSVSSDALHRPILCHIPLAQNGTPAAPENRHAGQEGVTAARRRGQNPAWRRETLSALFLAGLFSRKRLKSASENPYFPLK
jgi:hypothetical protein